jgi:hypothetical protein
MEPLDRSCDLSFPPWILVEIVAQPEFGTREWGSIPKSFDIRLTETSTGALQENEFQNAAEFKNKYTLLNNRGHRSEEPDENTVGALDSVKRLRVTCFSYWLMLLGIVSVPFLGARYYSSACVYEFEKLATLENWVEDFPCRDDQRDHYLMKCAKDEPVYSRVLKGFFASIFEGSKGYSQEAVQHLNEHLNEAVNSTSVGKGLRDVAAKGHHAFQSVANSSNGALSSAAKVASAFGMPGQVAEQSEEDFLKCNPDWKQIYGACQETPFGAVHPFLSISMLGIFTVPIPCTSWACDSESQLTRGDFPYFVFSILWVLGSLAMHYGLGRWIHVHEEKVRSAHT